MASQTLQGVNQNLPSISIFVYDSWSSECREYLSKNKVTETDTEFKQWLLHDLTVTSPGCLPRDPNNKVSSDNTYALQINCIWSFKSLPDSVTDIFIGLNKKVGPEMRADENDLKNRGLLLIMTDGVQDLFGCVLKPIKNLHINTVPGCKVLVKGPFVTSRYLDSSLIILLTEDNCMLLGGEVENWMEESYEHTSHQLRPKFTGQGLPEVYPSIKHFAPWTSDEGVRKKKRLINNINMPENKIMKIEPADNNDVVNNSYQISEEIVISDDEDVME